jgi:hypothetical protein
MGGGGPTSSGARSHPGGRPGNVPCARWRRGATVARRWLPSDARRADTVARLWNDSQILRHLGLRIRSEAQRVVVQLPEVRLEHRGTWAPRR